MPKKPRGHSLGDLADIAHFAPLCYGYFGLNSVAVEAQAEGLWRENQDECFCVLVWSLTSSKGFLRVE